jgi:hypothetical protein
MENKVLEFKPTEGLKSTHRKEDHFQMEWSIIAYLPKKNYYGSHFTCPVIIRAYGTQAMNYCCLWVNDGKRHASGSGSAGGYGYHRTSAAVNEAIRAAGIKLDKDIGGVGDSAIEEAAQAIAEYFGYKNFTLHKANP